MLESAFRSAASWKGRLASLPLFTVGVTACVVVTGLILAYILVFISPLFAILPILAVPAGIFMVTRPDAALLMVVFAIPFEDFNEVAGLPSSLSLLKLLSLVAFGGIVVHFLVFRRGDRLVSARQNTWVLLFLIAVIASNLVAIAPDVTMNRTFKLVRVLSLYLMTINVIKTEKGLGKAIWIILISGFLCALYGAYSYYFNPADVTEEGRISGTMDDPNEFAGAMVARIPIGLELLLIDRKAWRQAFLLLMIATMTYGVLLSGSRGGLIALSLSMLMFISRRKNKLPALIFLALAVPLAVSVIPPHLKERVGLTHSTNEAARGSTERRETYQILGAEIFMENPLLGIGMGGFADAYALSEFRFLQSTRVKRVAHNMYLEIAVGTGLAGLVPFLTLMAISLYEAHRTPRQVPSARRLVAISNGLFSGLGGFLLASLFLSEQFEKTLWLLVALTVVAGRLARTEQPDEL